MSGLTLRDICSRIANPDRRDRWVLLDGSVPVLSMPVSRFVPLDPQLDPVGVCSPKRQATFKRDPRLVLAWGMTPGKEAEDALFNDHPDWLPKDWEGMHVEYVAVIYCGSTVWQHSVLAANYGSGIDGYFPRISGSSAEGFQTSTWELKVSQLLNAIEGNDDFERLSKTVLEASAVNLVDADPLNDGLT